MESRDIDYTLMDVQRYGGGMSSLLMTSATMAMKLMVFLLRMAKKGLLSLKFSGDYQKFLETTGGNFTVYNIPLSNGHAERLKNNMEKIADLEEKLAETKNPRKRTEIRKLIEDAKSDMPELYQLEKLGVNFCPLPKVNGLENTIQVAVDNKDNPLFKNWFINHLSGELSGGKKNFAEIKAMTEGNTSIFNIPVEGEAMTDMLHDLNILGINYAVLPDLKVGDGCTQIAVANTDINTLKAWFTLFQQRQLLAGQEVPELYPLSEGAYTDTGTISPQEYIDHSDLKYQQANADYELQGQAVIQRSPIQTDSCDEYLRLCQDENYTKITIDKKTLIGQANHPVLDKIEEMGYFGCRVPGTYNNNEMDLMLPKDKVFKFRDGNTYVGFIPKIGQTKVYNCTSGKIERWSHNNVMANYDKVTRSLKSVKAIVKAPEQDTRSIHPRPLIIGEHQPDSSKNRFKNFDERVYDMELLEKLLMKKQMAQAGELKAQIPSANARSPKL